MVSNLKYDNILKIGYLNEKVEENMENYKKVYDVLILNDGSLEFVNNLLQSLI
jgi:5'-nucleotidase